MVSCFNFLSNIELEIMAKNYKSEHQLFELASLVHQIAHMQIANDEFEFNNMDELEDELDAALALMQLEKSSKFVGWQSEDQENNTILQFAQMHNQFAQFAKVEP